MATKRVHSGLRAFCEYGPLVGFLVAYLLYRDETFVIAGTGYSGFIAVTAAFIPVFLLGIGAIWWLTGKVARIQVVTAVMLVLFGGMSVWFNDPKFVKMKPTVVYLLLALILGIGLLRGRSWLQFVMEDAVPLKREGWMILTRRVTVLFVLSALANEVVWRTQSETFWVVFETVAMPIIVIVFFLAQVPLYVDHAAMPKKRRAKKKAS